MSETKEYRVEVTAHEDASVGEYLREFLSQLDSVTGVVDFHVERLDQEPRDISEVYRILRGLSDTELEQLEDAIDSYTEER